jgi:DNA-binding transcriptional LysR family regulator
MANLPDFEGLAIFAKVVEIRSFAGAAGELKLSKVTVSKAVSRIEARLGFDAAIRIAILPDSSLVARRICEVRPYLVGSPAYLNKYGRPKHPVDLAEHRCIGYGYTITPETWRFTKDGKSATVRPSGPRRVNNGDAMLPALIAGTGVGILPEFILRDALAAGRLERLMPDWSLPAGAVYWVMPPGGPRPKRVEVLANFLVKGLASTPTPAGKAKRR